jgi:hypothetical protein
MKIKTLTILLLILFGISCSNNSPYKTENLENSSRIKIVEKLYGSYSTLCIIEVDGHEYLSTYEGGIIHLESCKCKNK